MSDKIIENNQVDHHGKVVASGFTFSHRGIRRGLLYGGCAGETAERFQMTGFRS